MLCILMRACVLSLSLSLALSRARALSLFVDLVWHGKPLAAGAAEEGQEDGAHRRDGAAGEAWTRSCVWLWRQPCASMFACMFACFCHHRRAWQGSADVRGMW